MRRLRNALIVLALIGLPAGPGAWAQTVMKMASATINDVQHEWQKVFASELSGRIGN